MLFAASMLRRFVIALSLALCSAALAASTPAEGEYEGDGYAAQVFALPDGLFHIVGWRHGLPGVATNAERIADGDGSRTGDEIHFKGNIWTAILDAGGELNGTDDQGHHWTLQRIERASPTLGAKPPPGAVVLFDGSEPSAWTNGRTDDVHLLRGGTESQQRFESFTLHLEFRLAGDAPSAGALVIGGYYEIPLRDSFGREPDARSCGAILNRTEPLVNASFPRSQWQTLDIEFTAAAFDTQDRKTKNAVISVSLNGISIHKNQEIAGPTEELTPETPGPGPVCLRDTGESLRFRNIWVVEKP